MRTPFKVKNARGQVFTAYSVSGQLYDSSTIDDSGPPTVEGLESYELQDGTPLNLNDDGTFTNARTGEILTRI